MNAVIAALINQIHTSASLLALFQVLIAVFLHALCVCASDEMGALVQVAASRDEGRLISRFSSMFVKLQQLSSSAD